MTGVIPKRKVSVQMHLVSGDCLRGDVFLDYIDVIHRGEQTLLDKFNDDYPWFPVEVEDPGVIEVLNRDKVMLVEPGEGIPAELVRKENSPVFRRERVTLELLGERSLSGHIAMDLPDEFSRVSDFLNFPKDFFALETEDGPVLVSKSHVVSLVPHEKPPALPDETESEIGESV
jgi:hypothetical protein